MKGNKNIIKLNKQESAFIVSPFVLLECQLNQILKTDIEL
jgi:hypothetical protein